MEHNQIDSYGPYWYKFQLRSPDDLQTLPWSMLNLRKPWYFLYFFLKLHMILLSFFMLRLPLSVNVINWCQLRTDKITLIFLLLSHLWYFFSQIALDTSIYFFYIIFIFLLLMLITKVNWNMWVDKIGLTSWLNIQ